MVATFKKKHKVDPSKDKKAIQKLRREVLLLLLLLFYLC